MSESTKMTPEAQENLCIALAYDLVQNRLREGTATSQETVHFLKLGSSRNKEELIRLRAENELLKAKTESIKASQKSDEMFENAIKAMQRYRGDFFEDEEDQRNV